MHIRLFHKVVDDWEGAEIGQLEGFSKDPLFLLEANGSFIPEFSLELA